MDVCSDKESLMTDYTSLRLEYASLEENNTTVKNSFKGFSKKEKNKAIII